MGDYFGVSVGVKDGEFILVLNGTKIGLAQKRSAFYRMLDHVSRERKTGEIIGVTQEQIERAQSIIRQSSLPP